MQSVELVVPDTIILPWDAVKSKWTKEDYFRDSRWFLEFSGYADLKKIHHRVGPDYMVKQTRQETIGGMVRMLEAAKKDPARIKVEIVSFIKHLKGRVENNELGPTEVRKRITPIKLALDLNEVPIAWKNLTRLLPAERRSGDREYRHDEIQKLLAAASLHLQVAILFMASSGMRVGAFEYLNVGHVKPVTVEGKVACSEVTVYAGEGNDEYKTLISREACQKFQEYLEVRRAHGEDVTDESPLIVTRKWGAGTRYTVSGIRNDITRLTWKAGLRKEHKKRHEVQACHGLRKYFDNVAKDYIEEEYVEKLIGHDTGTKEHYDRHIPKPAIEQYLRAMPYLSIGQAYRAEAELSMKLEEKEREHSDDFNEMRLKLLEKSQEIQTLKEQVAFATGKLQEVAGFISEIKKQREREIAK